MTATAHALIGGAIAQSVQNPSLAITLALISHPIADLIPHWDFGYHWREKNKLRLFAESSLDLFVGIVLAFIFFGQNINPLYFLTVIFFAELPDILMMPYLLFNWKFPPFSTIYNIQHKLNTKAKLPFGIITQVATVFGAVLIFKVLG